MPQGSVCTQRRVSARMQRRACAVVLALVVGIQTTHGAHTIGEPQTLAGTTLQPVEDVQALVDGLIDMFRGGDTRDTKPIIERVVVSEDTARRLVVAVTYSGLANLRLTGEVRGRDRRRQPQVQVQPMPLTAASGEAALSIEVQSSVPEGTTIESAYLQVIASDPERSRPVVSRIFALGKTWNATPAASDVVVTVAPKAIGTAARLGSRPDYAPPPKVLVPMRTVQLSPAARAAIRRDHRAEAPAPATPPPPAAPAGVRVERAAQPAAGPLVKPAQRQAVVEKAKPAADRLAPNTKLVMIDRFNYGIRPEDAQKGAQGPAAAPIELLEGLRTEDIGLDPAGLLSISTSIYPDKNPASGIFYYHPRSYHLEWAAESGHGMRILYGAAAEGGTAGDVLMATRLQSGLDLSEVQLATELLNAYKRRNPSVAFNALRPLPLDRDGTDVSLGTVLGQYSIPKERIAITALSDVLGEIEVSWVTDPVTKENLQLALVEDIGVGGAVSFTATGGALAPQVPISIQLADRDSFGRLRWNRAEGPRNLTPYPLRLRYLHALCIDPRNNLPILYTWSLDNVEVPPMARVQWAEAARVPAWIDTDAKRIWIDYSVVQNCEACDQQVLNGITGGVTSVAAEQITFHTITPLADVGGYEITAQVRSKFFDPRDRAMMQRSAVLNGDNKDFTLRPIYNVARGAGEPLFEYLLELAMPDGTVHRGSRWIPSDGLRVLIGRAQLEQSLGTLPAKGPQP